MIRITKNAPVYKRMVFGMFCGLPWFMVLFFLLVAPFSILALLIYMVIVSLSGYIAYQIAYKDYTIWVDTERKIVIIENKNIREEILPEDFMKFRLEYIGAHMSNSWKYFTLELNSKKYRVRYITKKKMGFLKSTFTLASNCDFEESALREELKFYLE
jgi:hypothetical protein